MSTDNAQFASPRARDKQDTRRAKVAPLMAAGLSVRAISAETGIPVGAVHRAKRQLEKTVAQGEEKAHPRQRPPLALAGVERSERIETRRSTYELVVGADDQPDARRTEQMHVDVFHGSAWWGSHGIHPHSRRQANNILGPCRAHARDGERDDYFLWIRR
jgi:transposase